MVLISPATIDDDSVVVVEDFSSVLFSTSPSVVLSENISRTLYKRIETGKAKMKDAAKVSTDPPCVGQFTLHAALRLTNLYLLHNSEKL